MLLPNFPFVEFLKYVTIINIKKLLCSLLNFVTHVSLHSDMSSMAFIEPLPVIDFVAQILGKDVHLKPLSDADRVKV